jgi:hypothetical protein
VHGLDTPIRSRGDPTDESINNGETKSPHQGDKFMVEHQPSDVVDAVRDVEDAVELALGHLLQNTSPLASPAASARLPSDSLGVWSRGLVNYWDFLPTVIM